MMDTTTALSFVQTKLFLNGSFCDRKVRTLTDDEKNQLISLTGTSSVTEAAYWLVNGLADYPKKCLTCNGPSKHFTSFNQGYTRDYCCLSCSNGAKTVQDKKKQKSREIYGTDFPWQSTAIKQKISDKQKERNLKSVPTIKEEIQKQGFTLIEWDASKINNPAILQCNNNHIFSRQLEGWNRWWITCPQCSKTRSRGEIDVENFIKSLGFQPLQNGKRKILQSGKELDIYVPEKKLALEFNGIFYHSTGVAKDKSAKIRHITKQNEAETQGIKLLQILETEWMDKQDIVKSRIKSALGVCEKIYARNCTVVTIKRSECDEFLSKNHIQGKCISSVNLALKHKDQIVAVMTFAKPRFSTQAEWELLRFCNVLGFTVVGGASKLVNAFKRLYDPQSIISYADRRWSTGNLYAQLGFTHTSTTKPGYWYVKGGDVFHRIKFQKFKLKGLLDDFDETKSEQENMLNNGFRILWDCGNHVFIWNKSQA